VGAKLASPIGSPDPPLEANNIEIDKEKIR